jgi:hypothetical protein
MRWQQARTTTTECVPVQPQSVCVRSPAWPAPARGSAQVTTPYSEGGGKGSRDRSGFGWGEGHGMGWARCGTNCRKLLGVAVRCVGLAALSTRVERHCEMCRDLIPRKWATISYVNEKHLPLPRSRGADVEARRSAIDPDNKAWCLTDFIRQTFAAPPPRTRPLPPLTPLAKPSLLLLLVPVRFLLHVRPLLLPIGPRQGRFSIVVEIERVVVHMC